MLEAYLPGPSTLKQVTPSLLLGVRLAKLAPAQKCLLHMDMDLKDYPILVIVSKVFYAESLYCFVKPKVGYLTLHRSYMFADIYRIIPKIV